jgi:cold shock protein
VQAGLGELRPLHFPSLTDTKLRTRFWPRRRRKGDAALCRAVSCRGREPPQHQRNRQGDDVNAKGRVKFYNDAKGYGFLTRDDGAGDVFLHRSAVPPGLGLLYEGRPVSFDIEMTARGQRAVNVAVLVE